MRLRGGNGLRVLFRSGRRWAGPRFTTLAATDRELSVVYMGETLARCALPQHPPDNGDPWHDVLISYQTEEEGGDVGLRVEFDRVPCVARLELEHWRPQPSWRFGLAAASSEPDGVRHYVRRLVVRTGSRVQSSQIPLAVSPNAQQWSAPIDVAYTGPPTISALAPRTGPVGGGTLLALSGHALHGSRPLCRLADDSHVGLGVDHHADAGAKERLVIHERDTDDARTGVALVVHRAADP